VKEWFSNSHMYSFVSSCSVNYGCIIQPSQQGAAGMPCSLE
jgi:hypothetical protein